MDVGEDGARRTAFQVLAFPDVTLAQLLPMVPGLDAEDPEICAQVATDAVYAQYLDRQSNEIAVLQRSDGIAIDRGFDYAAISGLSSELRSKLMQRRPETMQQAGRIEGMTPAALLLLLAHLRKAQRQRVAS